MCGRVGAHRAQRTLGSPAGRDGLPKGRLRLQKPLAGSAAGSERSQQQSEGLPGRSPGTGRRSGRGLGSWPSNEQPLRPHSNRRGWPRPAGQPLFALVGEGAQVSTQEVTGSAWGAAGTGLPQQISQPLHCSFLTPLHPLPSFSILAYRSPFPCPGPAPHWRLPIAESAENGSSKQRAASPRSVNASDVVHERRVREPY